MRGRVKTTRKIYRLLQQRSMLNEERRQMFAALYFRSAHTLARRVSRRDARVAWRAAWADGVITGRQFVRGWLFFLVFRIPALRGGMMQGMQRRWPAAYFTAPSETLLKAPLQLTGATS